MKSLKMNLRWLLTACAMAAVCAMICLAPTARAAGGEVSGCAYVDANENLVHDESEQLITGVPVRLELRDGGAWTEAARTETDLYGKYAFTGLSAGEYRVICTLSGQELYAVSVGTSMASEAGAVVGDAGGRDRRHLANPAPGPGSLRSAAGEIDLIGRGPENSRHLFPGMGNRFAVALGEGINGRGISERLGEVGSHGLHHP